MVDSAFSTIDYVVFGAVILVSFAIGIYHSFKSSGTNEEYLMGGHSVGIIPMAISLCASFNSAYMILGIPSEIYTYGTQFFIVIVGIAVCVLIAGEIWIPILYNLKVVSIYEYFFLRYKSKFPRRLMSAIFILKTILYAGIVLYAPTIALSSVTSLPWWASILILGVSSSLYTSLGGILAIVWTDVFQIGIMLSGLLAIMIKGLIKAEGMSNVWSIADEGHRIEFFNPSFDPFERHTTVNLLFGSIILWGSPYICSQYLVHRCLCLDSLKKGKISLYLNFLGQILFLTIAMLIGLILYANYVDCDPVLGGDATSRDEIVPLFVVKEFATFYGVPGLFISSLFSGALSTLDSALHALATVTWEEMKELQYFQGISAKKETQVTKLLSLFYGIVAIGLAFLCSNLGSLIQIGGIVFGACMGPMFAYIMVSVLLPFVNLKGSSFGLIFGQFVNVWLSVGSAIVGQTYPGLEMRADNCSTTSEDYFYTALLPNATLPEPPQRNEFSDVYRLSYNLYPIIGFMLTATTCILVSLATGGLSDMKQVDSKYINPLMAKIFGLEKTSLDKLQSAEVGTPDSGVIKSEKTNSRG